MTIRTAAVSFACLVLAASAADASAVKILPVMKMPVPVTLKTHASVPAHLPAAVHLAIKLHIPAAVKTGTVRIGPGRIALRNPASLTGKQPQFGGAIQHGANQKVPGFEGVQKGVGINLPGGQRANGVKAVPGFDLASSGAFNANLPGSTSKHPDANAAAAYFEKQGAAAQSLVDQAYAGGVNGLNTPQGVDGETAASDRTSEKFAQAIGDSSAAGKTGDKTAGTGGDMPIVNQGTNTKDYGRTEKTAGGDVLISGQTTINYNIPGDGPHSGISGSEVKAGPIIFGTNKKMPGDDSISPVDGNSALALNNPYTSRTNGGGTDNNSESTQGAAGDLAPGSAIVRKDYGDGGSNDAGDNNHIDQDGALAANSVLAVKDQGDGGSADNRGGGGTNHLTSGKLVLGNGGGIHNQHIATNAMLK